MLERDSYPPGVPSWVDTQQPDPESALAFYGGLMGWEFEERTPAGAPVRYFIAKLRGRDVAGLGSQPEAGAAGAVWNTYVCVMSADDAAAKVEDAGGQIVMEPFDVSDAGRMAVLSDPWGAVFCVWEARGRMGAQLVNEPGTWNFSDLNTPDPEGANSFYGAVFGWEVGSPAPEVGDFGFWRMPGYGDFLAERDPDVRNRQADVGAPDGFEDAVAGLVPTSGPQPGDAPTAHWSLTFSVDDADAIAERAAKLGGEVVVPPFDAPWVRSAVLRDPQGAVFTASKFVPPT